MYLYKLDRRFIDCHISQSVRQEVVYNSIIAKKPNRQLTNYFSVQATKKTFNTFKTWRSMAFWFPRSLVRFVSGNVKCRLSRYEYCTERSLRAPIWRSCAFWYVVLLWMIITKKISWIMRITFQKLTWHEADILTALCGHQFQY